MTGAGSTSGVDCAPMPGSVPRKMPWPAPPPSWWSTSTLTMPVPGSVGPLMRLGLAVGLSFASSGARPNPGRVFARMPRAWSTASSRSISSSSRGAPSTSSPIPGRVPIAPAPDWARRRSVVVVSAVAPPLPGSVPTWALLAAVASRAISASKDRSSYSALAGGGPESGKVSDTSRGGLDRRAAGLVIALGATRWLLPASLATGWRLAGVGPSATSSAVVRASHQRRSCSPTWRASTMVRGPAKRLR